MQEVSSDHELQMPITGRPSNTSGAKPSARIQLRWMKPSRSCLPNQSCAAQPARSVAAHATARSGVAVGRRSGSSSMMTPASTSAIAYAMAVEAKLPLRCCR